VARGALQTVQQVVGGHADLPTGGQEDLMVITETIRNAA
jgi:hypothetical protein